MELNDSISILKGMGKKRAELMQKLNINTLGDLLYFFPRRYEDRRRVERVMTAPFDKEVLLELTVTGSKLAGNPRAKKSPLLVLCEDNTGTVELVFFNGKYLQRTFTPGKRITVYGKITLNYARRQMVHPEFHEVGDKSDFRGLLPVYPLTEGISQYLMREWQQAIRDAHLAEEITEWIPEKIVTQNKLCSAAYALENIHFPVDEHKVRQARFRLIFEELLVLQTGLFYIKRGQSNAGSGVQASSSPEADVTPFIESLPFKLTDGQAKVYREIEADMLSDKPMNRLVQGDVGSGKTIVAEMAMYKAVKSGFQAVMMAPTELLAKQHLASLRRDFEPFGLRVELLASSVKPKERAAILEDLADGKIDMLVGTHAVIQPDVIFNNLGLVITDEQHRFGVNQRMLLSEKGTNPDILVMTATPIPRTLAVILYGDLDISVIDTLPKGRKPIRTFSRNRDARDKIYDFVRTQVLEGRQAYVVCPLIEESEKIDCKSAEEIYEELSNRFRDLRVGLVHGAMKQDEKDAVMQEFLAGNIDILVSTVVIEVGIDVPNATVMVIENSERFGLAQLHQLRGRVGRGEHQSYCILISHGESKVAKQRSEIMCQTTDGFVIAEEDLKLRGPGELFGTKQHGLPELNIADLVRNTEILMRVKDVAKDVIEQDPSLTSPENAELAARVKKMFGERIQLRL